MSGCAQAANNAAWPSGLATSAATAVTLAPVVLRMSAAVASALSRLRPLTTTSHPASASFSAQARPSPLLEAQTRALRPAIPRSIAGASDWRRFACRLFACGDAAHRIAAPDKIRAEPPVDPQRRQGEITHQRVER